MSKKLSEMTLDELWELFPIVLTEHNDCWDRYYAEQATELKRILPNGAVVNHIVSTAISEVAKMYEALKLELWKKFEHDRDAYTQAKSEFVNKYTALAKQSRT